MIYHLGFSSADKVVATLQSVSPLINVMWHQIIASSKKL